MGFITSILIAIIGIFVIGLSLVVFIVKRIFGRVSGRKESAPGSRPFASGTGRNPGNPDRKEGEVSIDNVHPRKDYRDARPAQEGSAGDYVDYVEVKD